MTARYRVRSVPLTPRERIKAHQKNDGENREFQDTHTAAETEAFGAALPELTEEEERALRDGAQAMSLMGVVCYPEKKRRLEQQITDADAIIAKRIAGARAARRVAYGW